MRHSYWQEHDLPTSLEIAQEGICIGEEEAGGDEEILSWVKRLCYDIASFSWIGWDEAGISPTGEQSRLGLEMARRNLKYAIELNKGNLPTSRAYWMVGAHLLTSGEASRAIDEFEESETYAQLAGAIGEAELAKGFTILARLTSGQESEVAILVAHLDHMMLNEDAAQFVGQIQTAARIVGIIGLETP